MKHLVLAACFISVLATACQPSDTANASQDAPATTQTAQDKQTLREEIYERARKNNGGKEPTKLELLNELMGKAQEHVGAVKDWGKPRVVTRGPKPEIVIWGGNVSVDGKLIPLHATLDEWKRILPTAPTCDSESIRTLCVWHALGIQMLSVSLSDQTLAELKIYINKESPDPYAGLVTQLPDGTPIKPPIDYTPKHPFPGYLELDGFGIDAQTKFWEIRTSADPKRNLRCNDRDCSHPHGRFSDTANLYLRLNSKREDGNVYEFTISSNEAAETEPKQ